MSPLDTRQQKWLPLSLNPQTCVHDTTATSQPSIPFPELGKVYSAKHQFHYLQPPFNALLPSYDQKKVNCAAAPERALESSQKRYLIFDQSGNQTRLLQCGFASAMAAETDKSLHSLKPKILLHEEHVNGQEETEMHQDTEEINALLYSDDDDCESDDDDEVMSTGQSPFPVEQQACNKTREELDETQSSDDDDGPLRKRQKLQEHSQLDQSTKLEGLSDEKLHESNISRKQETGSGLSEEQSRKDKSQTALRILESVVPGAKGKEAFLLLDEAIDYLKLLKRNLNSSKHFLFD